MVKCAVIGVGTWGQAHANVYASYPRAELVAVVDSDEARAQKVGGMFNVPNVYTDYAKMLSENEIDIVSIVLPDFLHRECVERCVDYGVNILLEKPLATSREDLDAILKAVKQNPGKIFMVNYMMRWSPRYAKAKDAVVRGHLGEPLSGDVRFNDVIQVPRSMLNWAANSSPVDFVGIHIIDVLRWILGREVVEVYARSHKGLLAAEGIDTEDVVVALLTFDNGAVFSLEAGWVLPNCSKSFVDQKMRLVGTKGVIEVDHANGGVEIFSDPYMDPYDGLISGLGGFPLPSTMLGAMNGRVFGPHAESIRHFVDCVIDGRETLVTLDDCQKSTEIMLAVNESLKTGKPVSP